MDQTGCHLVAIKLSKDDECWFLIARKTIPEIFRRLT
jgi:hypothetical protein